MLIASLNHEEAESLVKNEERLVLVTDFIGLFADLSIKLIKGEREGLAEIKALVARKI
jgi:hypothetical protein